jgi:hypothetical protein
MKTTHVPKVTAFQSFDPAQLDTVLGGCNCGCGQATCNCANGSCGLAASAQRRPFAWR